MKATSLRMGKTSRAGATAVNRLRARCGDSSSSREWSSPQRPLRARDSRNAGRKGSVRAWGATLRWPAPPRTSAWRRAGTAAAKVRRDRSTRAIVPVRRAIWATAGENSPGCQTVAIIGRLRANTLSLLERVATQFFRDQRGKLPGANPGSRMVRANVYYLAEPGEERQILLL